MEQYVIPNKLDFKSLRFCLTNYRATHLFIRLVGSKGGTVKVDENLREKTFDFKKKKDGLRLFVDSKEVFHFPLENYKEDYQKGFSVAYERFKKSPDGYDIQILLPTGINPYDPDLPEPRTSILRTVWDNHLLEISFEGRINLKFHSWWHKPHWKYWSVDEPGNIPKEILKQQIGESDYYS